ncbi:MAG: alcohol dehydrogenase catalytic domain-containing protein [Syntrophobacterales bacterium]|nr:alcohol dehydrogenase catalytic domain-containing protein [Syntrophobacterales bacterium]
MQVAIWHNNSDIRIQEVDTPVPGPEEMLVKVHACGICGSDIVEWYRLPRAPLVPGHEIGAEVVRVGSLQTKFRVGERVFIAPKVPCLECDYCKAGKYPLCTGVQERLPGGFAEYILVPQVFIERGACLLPERLSFEESTFIEPLACVCHAQGLAGIEQRHTVMVMGCGMSGLLHVKLAKVKGCRVIATDINPRKLALASQNGADIALLANGDVPGEVVRQNGKKADVVIVCASPLSVINQAWASVDKGGAVAFFAVPSPEKQVTIPLNDFWRKEIRILTSYYCGPPDIAHAISLLASRTVKIGDMITHRLPLARIQEGFQLVLSGEDSLKVIIRPHDL